MLPSKYVLLFFSLLCTSSALHCMQNNHRYFATRHRPSFLRFVSSAPSSPAGDSNLSNQPPKRDILSDVNSAYAFLDAMDGRTFGTSSDDESSSEASEDDSNYTEVTEEEKTQDLDNPQPVTVIRLAALITSMPGLEPIDPYAALGLPSRSTQVTAATPSRREPTYKHDVSKIAPRKELTSTRGKLTSHTKSARKFQCHQPAKSHRFQRIQNTKSVKQRLKDHS